MSPIIDSVAYDPVLLLANARCMEFQLQALRVSYDAHRQELKTAIASWDEERGRALREASRVIEANKLLDEAFSHVKNPPLADAISKYLAQFAP